MSYRVRVIVRDNGERLPVLLRSDGIADLSGCVYATTALRAKSRSFNTILFKLRGVAALLSFCDSRDIDLDERVCSGALILPYEWQDFAADVGAGVGVCTQVARLSEAAHFLGWRARNRAAAISDLVVAMGYRERARDHLRACDEAIPRSSAADGKDGLDDNQLRLLASILRDEVALTRLWPDPFLRARNTLLLLWLLLLGHRIGELLAIRVGDIMLAPSSPECNVVRRHDDPGDPRALMPQVKGTGRRLTLPRPVMLAAQSYMPLRAAVCADHPFLLVASDSGAPLSASAVAAVFERLGILHLELVGVTPHTLRHTWVGAFRTVADRHGLKSEDRGWIAARAMGWADPLSDRFYARSQRQQAADNVSLAVQSEIMGDDYA